LVFGPVGVVDAVGLVVAVVVGLVVGVGVGLVVGLVVGVGVGLVVGFVVGLVVGVAVGLEVGLVVVCVAVGVGELDRVGVGVQVGAIDRPEPEVALTVAEAVGLAWVLVGRADGDGELVGETSPARDADGWGVCLPGPLFERSRNMVDTAAMTITAAATAASER
jgi:hypothetical protein